MLQPDHFNQIGRGHLPGHLGMIVTQFGPSEMRAEMPILQVLMAPNGFPHAGSVVALALFRCTQMLLYAKPGA
jgi:1,4-dihydroxy-2-naphthoyl-CoA hydrolase